MKYVVFSVASVQINPPPLNPNSHERREQFPTSKRKEMRKTLSKKIETANYPWVFWIDISYRPKWFKWFWSTRGANYIEFQVIIFRISIGMPWIKDVVSANQRDFGSAKCIHKTNKDNLRNRFSFLINTNPLNHE
jgi:hypothetical protein